MDLAEVHELVDLTAQVGVPAADALASLKTAVAASARLRAWLDGRDATLARAVAGATPDPERAMADAARCSRRRAGRVLARSATADALPPVADAMNSGAVSGEHVDVLTRAMRRLEPHQRAELSGEVPRLVELATRVTPGELERAVHATVRRIERSDGTARLQRQRRNARCRTWIDGEGMWCLSARFDPETGLRLQARIRATVEALFAKAVPDDCPTDPLERRGFLRAAAVATLLDGHGVRGTGHPDLIVVLDTTTVDADGDPVVDWGLPVELPIEVLHRWFTTATIDPVVLCRGAVVHAPGRLDLGRTTRLANRSQRRALRALYPTCAIPGCPVRFPDCIAHHAVWWEHGGRTDLVNLLPLCSRHHHCVHDRGWRLDLAPDRTLAITYPDGTTEVTGPPRRGAPVSKPADEAASREPTVVPLRT